MNPLNQCTCTQLELQKEDIPAELEKCYVIVILGSSLVFLFCCKDTALLYIFQINM